MNWSSIAKEINEKYKTNLQVVIPEELTDDVLKWYHQIDQTAFRKNLQYTDEELREKWNKPNKQLVFLVDETGPLAVHLGYELDDNSTTYYIDTLATKLEGKGIGSIIANYIKEYAKEEEYEDLQLDTEAVNERGVPLKHFYEKNGFIQIETYADGNITMKYKIK